MKRLVSALLVCLLIVSLCPAALASGDIAVAVNGESIAWTDAEPFIDENGRTLVPLRAVADAMGVDVSWDGASRTAEFRRVDSTPAGDADMVIRFTIGSSTANYAGYIYENGTGLMEYDGFYEMDTAPVIVGDRAYAPARYLAEFFGYHVAWDAESSTAYIGTYCLGDLSGYYLGDDGLSTLEVSRVSGGYELSISLYRLTGMEGTAELRDGKLYITFEDASGNPMEAILTGGDGSVLLTISSSSWTYIAAGDSFEFFY